MLLLLILGVAGFAFAAFLVGEVATLPARQREGSIKRAANYGDWRRRPANPLAQESFKARALVPASTALARFVLRINPKSTVESVSMKLLAAGIGRKFSATTYLAAKGLIAGAFIPLGAALASAAGKSGGMAILLALVFAAVGFVIPDVYVGMKARSRKEQIRSELPDALDLLAVSVEAGMGFDGAISKLTEHMNGALVEEFALTLGEMRIGETRENALKKMSDRVSTPELAAFTRAIIQADQLGISLGRILRVQAADTRNRRQAAAEERAMKAPIKMLFPTVVFIFPAMFLVVLGPAFLNLAKLF
jgi:tight adherence protein C